MLLAVDMVSRASVAFAAWVALPFSNATLLKGFDACARHRALIHVLELINALTDLSKRKEFVQCVFGHAGSLKRYRQRDAT
jgi:hypothetical protein